MLDLSFVLTMLFVSCQIMMCRFLISSRFFFVFKVKAEEDMFDDTSDIGRLFRMSAGADLEIDWTELQKVLNSVFQRGNLQIFLPRRRLT